jgi:uncharacterized protein (DUF433 family)
MASRRAPRSFRSGKPDKLPRWPVKRGRVHRLREDLHWIGLQAQEERAVPPRLDRITVDPAVMNGQPCIRGMRLTVRRVLKAAALYPDRSELKAEYPELSDEDIAQALDFAARNLDDQIFPLEAG